MRRKQVHRVIILSVALISFVLGMGAKLINKAIRIGFIDDIGFWLLISSPVIIFLVFAEFLLENKIYKGFRYFGNYWRIKNKLELQMIDANFGMDRGYYIELPKILLSFNDDISCAVLKISNSLKHENKLDNVVMSSALGKFIVETHYLSDDENFYVYELVDGSVSFKLTFDDFDQFLEYNRKIPPYQIFLDNRTKVNICHTLLVGQTGSGKSYCLYNTILQMLNKPVKYELFYADPKCSGLAVIGYTIAPERTAVEVSEIIKLLEQFVETMRTRKAEMSNLLKTQLEADYSTFGLKPYVFICDEYASFASIINSMEKKVRDHIKALLDEVVLQGRQLGFYLFIVMQKSDATMIHTALRENMVLKIVLSNAEQQTYVTAFGTGVDIPNRNYAVGEGVFTEPKLAPLPALVQCSYCDFDILEACKQSRAGVM